jgi:hypothetical protein
MMGRRSHASPGPTLDAVAPRRPSELRDGHRPVVVRPGDGRLADGGGRVEREGSSVPDRLAGMYARLSELNLDSLPAATSDEIGRLTALLPDLPKLHDPFVGYEAEVAIAGLTSASPGAPTFPRMIRHDLERRLRDARVARIHPAVWLVGGLVGFVFVVPAVTAVLLAMMGVDIRSTLTAEVQPTLAGERTSSWVYVALFGTLGAAVSVLQRVATFREIRGDRWVLAITGFTKPLIGAAFAMFVFTLIVGNVIPLTFARAEPIPGQVMLHPVHLAIAFLAGFSERLVPDLARNVEEGYVVTAKTA